jgi:hypothetical protein
MNRELGLRILSQIMDWEDDESREEFRWLSFMSTYKYDDYREYLAGARFIESLATWLQQFEPADRAIAYSYIKENLIYFSSPEIQRLVEKFSPEIFYRDLQELVSVKLGIPKYMVWSSAKSLKEFRWQARKALFMGLSDGARIDAFRRANAGVISNEQVAITTEINSEKWQSLLRDLEKDLNKINSSQGSGERFSNVYLIDDFTASGTSLIREEPLNSGEFKGKLFKFKKSLESMAGDSPLEENVRVTVHHYIGTEQAKNTIAERYMKAKFSLEEIGVSDVTFTFGIILPSKIKLGRASTHPFMTLCEKYYDPSLHLDEHFAKSGCPDAKYGYAECGLPVILEHNTPNNSLPLLWAETSGENATHAIRPLFRRRQRHTEFNS